MNNAFNQEWLNILRQSTENMWDGIAMYVPNLIVAILIFVIGWLVASTLAHFVAQIVAAFKIDNILKSLNVDGLLARGGFELDSGAFLGALVKWFIIVVALVASVDILGLEQVNRFLIDVVLDFLPDVIVAALILIVAAIIADAVRRLVVGSAKAAEVPSANLMGGVAYWAIWIFAILAALERLRISDFFEMLFIGLVAMLALAGGLAFGLGGRDAAARYIEKLRGQISGK